MSEHNKPIAYREGADIVFRMSSFGNCVKALAAALAGVEPADPPAVLLKAFAEGHKWEDYIIEKTEEEYNQEVQDQQITVSYRDGNLLWQGHPDGSLIINDERWVVDAKNLGGSNVKSFLRGGLGNMQGLGQKYAAQALIYIYAMDAAGFVLAVRSKDDNEMYFEEYSIEQLKELSGLNKRKMRKKARMVEKVAIEADLLNAECDYEAFGCPYYFLHTGDLGEGLFLDGQDISPLDDEIVNGLVKAKMMAAVKADEANNAKRATDEALKNWINGQKEMPEEIDGTDESKKEVAFKHETIEGIKFSRFRGSSTALDQKAMRDDGIDLDKYRKKSYHMQVRVTPKKEEDG